MRKCSVASNGSKAANQKGQFYRLLAAAVHIRKMALLALGSVAVRLRWPIPAYPLVGKKQMALFTKKIITLRKKWVKLAHSPFPTARQSQLAPLTSHSALFAGQPDKGQAPSWRMGKMTFSAGLLTHPRSSLLKKSEPSAKNPVTSAK